MVQKSLTILSEGPYHIAVFKPHGLAVVGGRGVVRPTLLDLMRERFGQNIFAVHRLDRSTAGIVVFARSIFAKHAMDNAFKKRLVKKIYYALCEGKPTFKKTSVDSRLKKTMLFGKGAVARQSIDEAGMDAKTNVRVIAQIDDDRCLIEAQPTSGRFHQIRAHLAHIGLPIVGDRLYGSITKLAPHTIALCAVKLTLPLPKGGVLNIDISDRFDPSDYQVGNNLKKEASKERFKNVKTND